MYYWAILFSGVSLRSWEDCIVPRIIRQIARRLAMELRRTYCSEVYRGLVFEHLVEFYGYGCLLGSAHDQVSGKLHLFLIFREWGRIFHRHGMHDIWEEVRDEGDHGWISTFVEHALLKRKIYFIRRVMFKSFLTENFPQKDLSQNFREVKKDNTL